MADIYKKYQIHQYLSEIEWLRKKSLDTKTDTHYYQLMYQIRHTELTLVFHYGYEG